MERSVQWRLCRRCQANIPLDNDWHVVGTGDFNGDGIDDILWRNDNGVVGEWDGKSNGGFVGDANANILLTNDWHVVATGDFNGDGINDICGATTMASSANGTASPTVALPAMPMPTSRSTPTGMWRRSATSTAMG